MSFLAATLTFLPLLVSAGLGRRLLAIAFLNSLTPPGKGVGGDIVPQSLSLSPVLRAESSESVISDTAKISALIIDGVL